MATHIDYVSLAEMSGYGLAAQGYMQALTERGVSVRWRPLLWDGETYDESSSFDGQARLMRLEREHAHCGYFASKDRTVARDGESADIVVHHTVPELWQARMSAGALNVGLTVWETDRLPGHWPDLCRSMDRILVPGAFSQQLFAQAVPSSRVRVVPHAARNMPQDVQAARDFRARYGIPDDHFMFYTINAWTCRKAPWLTLHAYLQAFDRGDPVTLVVKTDSVGEAGYGARERKLTRALVGGIVGNYPEPPHVCLIDREIPPLDVDALHGAGNCYVSLAHAEGWGLGAFEAGAAGNPVIATGWSGWLDYLTEANAYLVAHELRHLPPNPATSSYSPDQRWAVADLDDAISIMKGVRADPAGASKRGQRLQQEILRRFSSKCVGQSFLDALA